MTYGLFGWLKKAPLDTFTEEFNRGRRFLSCSMFIEAAPCFIKAAESTDDPVLKYEALRQLAVIARLLGKPYEEVFRHFAELIAEMRAKGLHLSVALCLRDFALLHRAFGRQELAKASLAYSTAILEQHDGDFDWPKPFDRRSIAAELAINKGFERDMAGIIECDKALRRQKHYRDSRLDIIVLGVETSRRTLGWHVVAWWAIKGCTVALLRLYPPRWKRAVEILILASLGAEVRDQVKAKYLRRQ